MPMNGSGQSAMRGNPAVADQLTELHAKMQRLEAAIQQQSGPSSGAMPMSGTAGMGAGNQPPGFASGAYPSRSASVAM